MKKFTIVLAFLVVSLLGLKTYCDKCQRAEECLAKGHEWHFKEVTMSKKESLPPVGSRTTYYVWGCTECGVRLYKCPAELTQKEKDAIMALNPDGQMMVFMLKSKMIGCWRN